MKIFNRGRRTFNPGTPSAILPGRWTELPDDDAKKMLRMYPRDLTSNDQPSGPTPAEIQLRKENAELKKRLAKYEAQMDNLEKVATEPTKPVEFNTPVDPVAESEIQEAPAAPAPKAKKAKTPAQV
jgi:hypothetical protein